MVNYYDILGISPHSTVHEIKKEYRKLVLKYHPDVCKDINAEENFKRIVEAFKTLSDPKTKHEYDIKYYDKKYRVVSTFPNVKEKQDKKEKPKKTFLFPSVIKNIFLKMRTVTAKPDEKKAGLQPDDYFRIDDELTGNISIEELNDKFYKSDNKYVRMQALKYLVVKNGIKSFKEIEKALTDIAKEVKIVAVRSAGYLNIRQFIKPLNKLFKESGRELRKEIVLSLSQMDSAKAMQCIIDACFDSDNNVQITALTILKNKGFAANSRFKNLLFEKNDTVVSLTKELLNRHS